MPTGAHGDLRHGPACHLCGPCSPNPLWDPTLVCSAGQSRPRWTGVDPGSSTLPCSTSNKAHSLISTSVTPSLGVWPISSLKPQQPKLEDHVVLHLLSASQPGTVPGTVDVNE